MENFSFDLPKNRSAAIKVIGVGGAGTNAVNYMFEQGIAGVDFAICNTDSQALKNSPVPLKIQLGVSITEGLGAGANPDIGEQSAIESIEEVKALYGSHTKMVFITAGMGGGTGTGAAPIIAGIAKELGILTVGIVTVPFFFEGKARLEQAEKGLEKLRNNVDSLIVINNDKLRELYGNLGYKTGFAKADEVLSTAAKGIAEVITQNYTINIDLRDAKTVLSESGTAIMGSAKASGPDKAKEAIKNALDSPLLNDNRITGAKNILLLILSGAEEITIDEIGIINDYIQSEAGYNANIIMGVGEDLELGNEISVTIVATGFPIDDQKYTGREEKKIVHTLKEDQPISKTLSLENINVRVKPFVENETVTRFVLEEEEEKPTLSVNISNENDEIKLMNIQEEKTVQTINEPIFNFEQEKQKMNDSFQLAQEEKTSSIIENLEPTIFNLDDYEDHKEEKSITLNLFETEVIKEEIVTEINTASTTEETFDFKTSFSNHAEGETQLTENFTRKNTQASFSNPIDIPIQATENDRQLQENLQKKIEERRARLKQFNAKYNNLNTSNVEEMEKIPAFQRQGVHLDESKIERPKFYLDTDGDDIQIRPNNFLHDNVD